jgi:hypothetical protein
LPALVAAHIGRAAVSSQKLFDRDEADYWLSLLRGRRRHVHLRSFRPNVFHPWSYALLPWPAFCSGLASSAAAQAVGDTETKAVCERILQEELSTASDLERQLPILTREYLNRLSTY